MQNALAQASIQRHWSKRSNDQNNNDKKNMAQKIIIDTDPGIDDAFAILFAALHPDLDLVALTTIFGNVTSDIAARNAKVLSEMVGLDIPVSKGADRPLVMEPNPPSDYVHGEQGFGDLPAMQPKGAIDERSSAQLIVDLVNESPGEIVLCPIGPFTNIALALELDPSIQEKTRLVMMGGGLDRGNVTPYAEANIWNDPHAADRVFAASWDMTMVGLDVTSDIVSPPSDFEALAKAAPVLGGFLNEAAKFYARFYMSHYNIEGCQMHDPAAMVAVLYPELFTIEETAISVVPDGELIGATLRSVDPNRRLVKACVGGQDQAIKDVFLNTIKTGH